MNVHLMFKDRDFDPEAKLPDHTSELIQDLAMESLFAAMADGDTFLRQVAEHALLSPLMDVGEILYRQEVLKDAVNHPSLIREIYQMALDTIQKEKQYYFGFRYPDAILHRSLEVLRLFLDRLKLLMEMVRAHESTFESEGFLTMIAVLKKELDDDFFEKSEIIWKDLNRNQELLFSATLGKGNKGVDYLLRQKINQPKGLGGFLFSRKKAAYSFQIHERDESGARALSEMKNKGIEKVASTLANSMQHMLHFFIQMRNELAFFVGAIRLHDQLRAIEAPVVFPVPLDAVTRELDAASLYDVCLALSQGRMVVGNDVSLQGKALVVITGANQGGKTTFLRSVGLSHLMMQSGMFVSATSFCMNVATGIYTHFTRQEDTTMKSGKLDEEMRRMSGIVDSLRVNSLLLCNESFASTNEREGSEIAKQIMLALVEKGVQVIFVTHFYEFASDLYQSNHHNVLFLRALRLDDGKRTYRIVKGRPLPTSYGEDIFREVFG